MSDDEYFEFCASNPDIRYERKANGEIFITPPGGGESDFRCLDLAANLFLWSRLKRKGKVFGATAAFILPSGAVYSPDAAWVSNGRLGKLTPEQRRKFLKAIPEFVAEVMSPSDRLKAAQAKMAEWMTNGVDLGWLLDGDSETVYVYRAGKPDPEIVTGAAKLSGEGPIEGFELDLVEIWEGLSLL